MTRMSRTLGRTVAAGLLLALIPYAAPGGADGPTPSTALTATSAVDLPGIGLPVARTTRPAPTSRRFPADSSTTYSRGQTTAAERVYARRIVYWTNQQRRTRDLRPLRVLPCLGGVATQWSERMARTGAFEHRDLTEIWDICPRTSALGENIAYGNVSARHMVQLWMDSPGHRANILEPTYTHLGGGGAVTSSGRWYGTQDFASLR